MNRAIATAAHKIMRNTPGQKNQLGSCFFVGSVSRISSRIPFQKFSMTPHIIPYFVKTV